MQCAGRFRAALALAGFALAVGCGRPTTPARPVAPNVAPRAAFIDQFDALWTRFDDVYPSFAYKRVDWNAQRARYRPRAERARSQDELVAVLIEMLAPLHDRHVWLVDPRGQAVPTYRANALTNFDRARWEAAMRDASIVRRNEIGEGLVGGYAYLYIGTWRAPVDIDALDLALERARDAQGLIIDLRTNAGGSDGTAMAFAGRFTRRAFPASYVEIRTDPRVTDVEMPLARTIAPRGPWQFTRPVVLITGRGGLSATESFAAAMRTLPQVTVIGDTTGGASGNPATFALGNGWQFTVPRWLEYGPDRQPIEGRGVAPHLAMAWDPASYDSMRDPLIDAAVGLLGERTGVYRIAPSGSADPPSRQLDVRDRH
ncbi:MAG TPA: hypothetical protein DGD08_06705 [Gemmatimonas aurantiaca]|uniref:Tail specific protease domain-containing protein n=2 Tax=Gemmatimonas aurantiaca TaxID=173480 RepID=A0A3D4V6W4_9BACT|nr:S41 family peptidase [Gemmatimonas aurantiaca]BAH38115.1 putative peptidase [Gemmatimonas aurantiaca T-27]HCT56889.1 hypothetical protein [Gemmatimonas aurantiaca]